MKKNGFTLVELLAVIVILALIMTVAVPSTLKVSDKIKKNMFCAKIDSIEVSAKLYGEDRRSSMTSDGIEITVKDLVDHHYLRKDQDESPIIVDPRNKKSEDLYNMTMTVYLKNKRVYVKFNDEINTACEK